MKKKDKKNKGLSDKELSKKYGGEIDKEFNRAIKDMLKEPNPNIYKTDKNHIKKSTRKAQ